MATDALSHQAIQSSMNPPQAEQMHQYTLWKILGIWALVAVPMALLGWMAVSGLKHFVRFRGTQLTRIS